MKKKIILTTLLTLSTVFLCSCGFEQKVNLNKNGTATYVLNAYTTPDEEHLYMEEISKELEYDGAFSGFMQEMGFTQGEQKKLNGMVHNRYYMKEKCPADTVNEMFIVNNKKQSVYNLASADMSKELAELGISEDQQVDLSVFAKYAITIKYPFKVYKTNGAKQSDGYTVVYDLKTFKDERGYAVSNSKTYKTTTCKIKNVKNKSCYNTNKKVVLESDGVITQFHVNGKPQENNTYTAKKDGKYKLEIKLASGASKKLSFTIDKTKPTTNIKNNKTYKGKVTISCSDKTSGVKKITLNGKKISNNKVVSKKGSYKLQITDKAGNVRSVNFKIK